MPKNDRMTTTVVLLEQDRLEREFARKMAPVTAKIDEAYLREIAESLASMKYCTCTAGRMGYDRHAPVCGLYESQTDREMDEEYDD